MCTRCVMDSTHSNTDFDTRGVCRHCRDYDTLMTELPREAEVEIARERMINDIKKSGKGRDYDCLLGLSGGVDSSYLACLLKSWGLRVLAFQFDNGWNSELAIKNIELICTNLSLDLYTYVVEWREFRDLQLAFLRAGVANIEAPSDHGIFASMYAAARKYGIKEIITGVNFATEHANVGFDYGYAYSDLKHLKAIHRRFSNTALRTFPMMHYLTGLAYKNVFGINTRQPLNLINYNKLAAIDCIKNEIGWKPYVGKHGESVITRFHQAYILPKKFKRDKRIIHLSDLIHSGQITRDKALEELQKPPYDPALIEQDRVFVIKKFGISDEEFSTLMSAPPVDYRVYPNSQSLYYAVNKCVKLKHWLHHRKF